MHSHKWADPVASCAAQRLGGDAPCTPGWFQSHTPPGEFQGDSNAAAAGSDSLLLLPLLLHGAVRPADGSCSV